MKILSFVVVVVIFGEFWTILIFVLIGLVFKMLTKLKTISKWQAPIVRALHLFTSHMPNLNIHKVEMSIF